MKRAVDEADEAELTARRLSAALSGRLRISSPVTFARLYIVPRRPRFTALHPALDVEVFIDDSTVDLVEAGIDVALRMGDLQDSSPRARSGHGPRAMGRASSSGRRATSRPRRSRERGARTMWSFTQGTSERSVTIKGRMRCNAPEGVREAVFAGLGLTAASAWMFRPELASGRVRRVLAEWKLPPVDLWVVFPTGRNASMKPRAFAQFIEQDLGADFAGRERTLS